jgi:predicted phage tail protein
MSKREHTERLRAAARLAEEARIVVAGAKKDGGGQRAPVEAADSLRSSQTAQVLDLLSEGEIGGLVNGDRSIYLDGVPLKAEDGSYNFQDVVTAWTHGTQGQAALPELSGVQNEVGVGVAVPFATPAVRSIANLNVDTVRVTINVPQISSTDTSNGDINGSSFTWAVDVQANGGGYVEVFQDTVSGKKMSSYKRARKFPLTGTGPWNVRVRRISGDSGSANVVNAFLWESYTEIQSLKLRYPNSALVMLAVNAQHFNRIPTRAYDILGIRVRVPSNYNPLTRAYTGIWDGTFQVAWTNNPAWIFLELISNERWGLGSWLAQAGLNAESAKWQLYTISQYCDGMVSDGYGGMEPRFTCNAYIQTREQALQVVQHFAAIFRGAAFWAAGELHITQDAPSDPVALFTPANVMGGRFSYQTGSDKQRHSVFIVYWNDLAQLGRRTPEVWSPDHLVARFGLKELPVEPIGITRRGQALRLAKWMAYTEEHEGRVVAFKVGSQGALVLPGQVFQVADPSEAGERLGGRIRAATASQVTLDAPVTLLAGEVYTLTVQLPDPGDQAALITEERAVTNAAGPTSVLNLAAPYSQAPAPQAVWILQSNNIAATTWRCLSCRESDDGTEYEITALAHDPAKFAAVEQGIVLEPRPVTRLPTQVKPPPIVNLTPQVYQDGQTWRIKLLVSWVPSAPGLQHIVSWRMAQGSWVTLTQTVDQAVDVLGLDPGTVQVEVRAVNALGTVSVPASASTVVAGNTAAAAVVTNLAYSIDALGALIRWEASPDFDWDATELRVGASWDAAEPIMRARATSHRWGWQDNGTYPILARHIRRSGPQGPVAAINVTINDAEPLASVLEGLIGPEQLEDFAVDASKLAGGAVNVSKLALEIGGGNLLSNSSFEKDTDGNGIADFWTTNAGGSTGTVTSSVANAACIHGTNPQRVVAAALAAGNANQVQVRQLVTGAFAGRKLVFSAYASVSAGVGCRVVVDWLTSVGAYISSSNGASEVGSGAYKRLFVSDTAPALAAQALVHVIMRNGTGAAATMDVDAAQLEFGDVLTAYAPRPDELLPGSVTSTALADLSVTLGKIAAAAVDATKLAVEIGGGNLLSNSSFERDTDGNGLADSWVDYSPGATGTTTRTLNSTAVYGSFSQRVIADALSAGDGNRAGVKQENVSGAFAGKKMALSAWILSSSTCTTVLHIEWQTSGGGAISSSVGTFVGDDTTFLRRVLVATAPATAALAQVYIYVKSGNGGSNGLRIDGAQLEFGDVVTAYAPRPDEILAGSVVSTAIADGAVTAIKTSIAAINAASGALNAGTVDAAQILTNAITSLKIAAGAVTAAKTAIAAIDAGTGNLTANSVTATQIAAGAVVAGKIAADAVTANEIAANAVGVNELAAGAVTTGKLAAGAVTTLTLAAGAVTANELAANAVTANKILAGAIVAGKIAANAVGANEIAAGSVTTSKLLVTGKANTLNADPDCQDASAWLPSPTGTGSGAIVTDAAVKSGNKAWEGSSVSGPTNVFELYSSMVPIDASKNHRVEIDARSVSGASGAYLLVAFYDANTVVLSGSSHPTGWPSAGSFHYFGLTNSVPPPSYTTFGISFGPGEVAQIPSGAKFCRIGALLAYTGTGVNRASNFNLWEKTNGELIVDGAIVAQKLAASAVVAGKIAANAVTSNEIEANAIIASKIAAGAVVAGKIAADAVGANQIAAGSVTTNKLVVTGKGMALNDDPGTSDATAWVAVSGAFVIATITDGGAGTKCIRTTSAADINSRRFQATAGRQYRVSAYARRTSGTPAAYIRLECRDGSGGLINSTVTAITPAIGNFEAFALNAAWTKYVGVITAGANTVTAELRWSPGTGSAEVQDFRVEEYVGADLIVDGAIVATKLAANAIAVGTAAIQNGAIVNAHIGNLAVDNAKISALDAAKINTGSLDAARIAAGSLNADRITAGTINTDRLIIGSVSANVVAQASSVSLGTPASNSPFNAGPANLIGITKQQGYILFSGQLEFQFILGTGFTGVALHMGVSFDITPDPAGDTSILSRFDRVPVFTEPAGPFKMARLLVPISHVIPTSAANGTYSLRASFSATGRDAAGATVVFGSSPFLNASYGYEVNAVEIKV